MISSMIYNNVLELIGKTPMVKYNESIYLKLEYFNPSSSIKDRASYSMLNGALERGEINKDTVIIEPTSGNTGIDLAMCCAVMGLKLIICMPESMSLERRKNISAYGAELVLTPAAEGMQGSVNKAYELKKIYPNSYIPMQFENTDNPKAHQKTAHEIFDDTEGTVDIFVAGIGTGGTAAGINKYLKELKSDVKVFGVEPAESALFSTGIAGSHKIQGIGANFIPKICENCSLDGILTIEGERAINMAKKLAHNYGIFCGISAGANASAAIDLSKQYPDKKIVTVIPDSGERYLSVW